MDQFLMCELLCQNILADAQTIRVAQNRIAAAKVFAEELLASDPLHPVALRICGALASLGIVVRTEYVSLGGCCE